MRKKTSNHSVMATWLGVTLFLMQSLVHAETETLERIEWKKAPIRLELAVGQEQRIEFPAAVKVGVPASVQGVLRTQSVNGMVYLLAQTSFGSNRLMIRELDSGRIYLFDITATEDGGSGHPIHIYVTGEQGSEKDQATGGHEPEQDRPDFVQLTSFAAQQLYASARLVKDQPGIVRVPVSRDSVDLYHGGAVEGVPLVAWRAKGLYVTAVKLINRTEQALTLDPRNIRGTWLTATFQHHRLFPKGDEADTTAVYLISARPFGVSY
ncbi:MAG: TIGR03749 family integrating conjugative element protein [Candidatus Sedimenticola endophacoides]